MFAVLSVLQECAVCLLAKVLKKKTAQKIKRFLFPFELNRAEKYAVKNVWQSKKTRNKSASFTEEGKTKN